MVIFAVKYGITGYRHENMQKFIITSRGLLKYGNVRMHKDLLSASDICMGGGYYEFDYISDRLLLSGSSFDYGRPRWHYVDVLRVSRALRGLAIYYEGEPLDIPVEYV